MSGSQQASSSRRRIGAFACAGILAIVVVLGTATVADLTPNDPKLSSQYGVRRTHEDLAATYAGGIDFASTAGSAPAPPKDR